MNLGTTSVDDALVRQFARAQRLALIAGLAGLAVSGLGAFTGPRPFFFAYLFGYLFWMGLTLGGLCVLMIHHLVGGGWGFTVRRFLEAATATLPLMAVLFIPVCLGLRQLYPWMDPAIVAHTEALQRKHAYLNIPAFAVRMVFNYSLWIVAAFLLNRWSADQDGTGSVGPTRRMRTFSGPGLLFFTLTVSVAVVDWVMVLERDWYSTIFPVLFIIGGILSILAFCTVMLVWVGGREPWRAVVRTEHYHSLGNLLLAFVMMWAYLTVSQLIIIWSGNLPKEIGWYLHRVAGGWRYVAIALGLLQFALPFFLLLSRQNKEDVRKLGAVAAGILVMQVVVMGWYVLPSLYTGGLGVPWTAPFTLLGVGGLWMAGFFAHLKSRGLIPQNDPRLEPDLIHGH